MRKWFKEINFYSNVYKKLPYFDRNFVINLQFFYLNT